MPEKSNGIPLNNNQTLVGSILVVVLAALIIWAGSSIANQGEQVIRLEVSQSQLIKTVEKLTQSVERVVEKDGTELAKFERLDKRIDRLWEIFRQHIKADEEAP